MLESGQLTDGEWNYYGGSWEYPMNPVPARLGWEARFDWKEEKLLKEALLIKVKEVGIDWEKTVSPVSSHANCFEGTFNDSSEVETLLGTLFLKDGSEYIIGVSNSEKRFSDYVKHLMKLMEDKERVKSILGE